MDKDGGVFISEGVSAARYQSRLPFKSRVEGGGGVILPRLQGLVFRDFSVPFGAVLGEGVHLEERGGFDGGE